MTYMAARQNRPDYRQQYRRGDAASQMYVQGNVVTKPAEEPRRHEGFEYGMLMPFREGTSSNKWFYSMNIDTNSVRKSIREIITAFSSL